MSSAVAIFLRSDCKKKVLLIKRRDVPVYALPGGGIDSNETAEKAAIREMMEETGLHVKVVRIIGYYYPISILTYPTILFECEKIGGHESISNETQEVEYFLIDKLPNPLPPPYAQWIQDAVKNTAPCFKPIEGVTIIQLFKFLFSHPILVIRFLLARLKIPINS